MGKRISEVNDYVIGLVGQTINNTNVTGNYVDMRLHKRLAAILIDGASASTKVTTLKLVQATDASGTAVKDIASYTAAVTAGTTGFASGTIALSNVQAADAMVINGLTYTAHATVTTLASRQYSIAGSDTADGTELCKCLNDATYGVPGVTATNNAGTITLTVTSPGTTLIKVTTVPATITVAQLSAAAFVECTQSAADLANGFYFVAANVARTGNGIASVLYVLETKDYRTAPEANVSKWYPTT